MGSWWREFSAWCSLNDNECPLLLSRDSFPKKTKRGQMTFKYWHKCRIFFLSVLNWRTFYCLIIFLRPKCYNIYNYSMFFCLCWLCHLDKLLIVSYPPKAHTVILSYRLISPFSLPHDFQDKIWSWFIQRESHFIKLKWLKAIMVAFMHKLSVKSWKLEFYLLCGSHFPLIYFTFIINWYMAVNSLFLKLFVNLK